MTNHESRCAAVLILAVTMGGCGKKSEVPPESGETEEYRAWKGGQAIRQLATAGPSEKTRATVTVHFPQVRSKSRDDFIELRLNGDVVQHTRFRPAGGGQMGPFGIPIDLRPGANWLDLWDSTTNKNFRFQVDPREATDFVLAPAGDGYEIRPTKRE